jgi:hypothetical protein
VLSKKKKKEWSVIGTLCGTKSLKYLLSGPLQKVYDPKKAMLLKGP